MPLPVTTIERDIHLIKFKFARILRTEGARLMEQREKHPDFDETPGKYPNNEGIYCRGYCPVHPEVHRLIFDFIEELARACEARSFHVGMDEVFILADPDCPRCRGKNPAQLFAGEVKTLRRLLQFRFFLNLA